MSDKNHNILYNTTPNKLISKKCKKRRSLFLVFCVSQLKMLSWHSELTFDENIICRISWSRRRLQQQQQQEKSKRGNMPQECETKEIKIRIKLSVKKILYSTLSNESFLKLEFIKKKLINFFPLILHKVEYSDR